MEQPNQTPNLELYSELTALFNQKRITLGDYLKRVQEAYGASFTDDLISAMGMEG